MSKRSWIAVATLLTFWPPGPEDAMDVSSISSSGIAGGRVTWLGYQTARSRRMAEIEASNVPVRRSDDAIAVEIAVRIRRMKN